MLQGKKILLGISGSIAAYKSILLVRLLVSAGAEVKVVMTAAAKDFVSPLVLSTLSKNQVLLDLADESTWTNHVMLGRWADVMLIAPLSCNTLAKMAAGLCDNLLLATYLSATCPVAVAPAMDEDMWLHPSTKKNITNLEAFGHKIISPGKGELASGLYGEGRMAEPEEIIIYLEEQYFRKNDFSGKSVLITAGPTFEPLDPVRFIGNHSSGKMGFAIAEAFYAHGADVTLVSGPVQQKIKCSGIRVIRVNTAQQMYDECKRLFSSSDITVMAAAVADYTPVTVSEGKIKKNDDIFQLELTKTRDILQILGSEKREDQLLIGFALETHDEEVYALKKLKAKNADAIVLNSLRDSGAGFETSTNRITIFNKSGERSGFETKDKKLVAEDIVSYIKAMMNGKA